MSTFALVFSRKLSFLAPALLLGVLVTSTAAQSPAGEVRPRRAEITERGGILRLENDLEVVLPESPVKQATAAVVPGALRFRKLITEQISHRLGAPYVYGAAGPWYFDCSGFVWSVFQAAGVPFERTSARSLWADFTPVKNGEEYKFGTLVFFNNLQHVGIVVDQAGFYHASRTNGVTYSSFNDYWTSRIDGFRRIPEPLLAAD